MSLTLIYLFYFSYSGILFFTFSLVRVFYCEIRVWSVRSQYIHHTILVLLVGLDNVLVSVQGRLVQHAGCTRTALKLHKLQLQPATM